MIRLKEIIVELIIHDLIDNERKHTHTLFIVIAIRT